MPQEQVVAKAMRIRDEGRGAYTNGTVNCFHGFSETLTNRYAVFARFKARSEWNIQTRVLRPLESIERSIMGTTLLLAARDYPLHCTILEAQYRGEDSIERNSIFNALDHNDDINAFRRMLINVTIPFTFLICDKNGGLLITADEVPSVISGIRNSIARIYEFHGLMPLPIEDLLHATVARVMTMPLCSGKFFLPIIDRIAYEAISLPTQVSYAVGMNSYNFLT